MSFELRPYQKKCNNDIFLAFKEYRKVCLQLATGGGKTFTFAIFAKYWVQKFGKVCILVHRQELVNQTVEDLRMVGLTCVDTVEANKKSINQSADVFVCMVETFDRRLKKGLFNKDQISLIIADECHRLDFIKVIDQFSCKILGVTATPVIYKKETFYKCRYCKKESTTKFNCCGGEEADEWSRDIPLARFYEKLVVSISIRELIDQGFLCEDVNFIETPKNIGALVSSNQNEDGYSTKSIKEVFENKNTCFNVLKYYNERCKGKKTLIFNSTTGSNLLLLEQFKEAGVNVKMYDSVNSKKSEREAVVQWFKSERDAVLLNVGVFTTGFDVRDVECIILNKATKSLSLFLQMVGRGARTTKGNEIYKDKFIVIDGGENIARFNRWSAHRDWNKLFYGENTRPRVKKEDVQDITICPFCGAMIAKQSLICEICKTVLPPIIKLPKEVRKDTVLQAVQPLPLPSSEKIYEYTKRLGENVNFAYKILANQIIDLFRYYQVPAEQWNGNRKKNEHRIKQIVRSVYFGLMKKQDIQTQTGRKLSTLYDIIINKIDKYYEK